MVFQVPSQVPALVPRVGPTSALLPRSPQSLSEPLGRRCALGPGWPCGPHGGLGPCLPQPLLGTECLGTP